MSRPPSLGRASSGPQLNIVSIQRPGRGNSLMEAHERKITNHRRAETPSDNGVPGKRATPEGLQIIIYARPQSGDECPVSAQNQTWRAEDGEEECPSATNHDEGIEILTRTFDFFCPHKSCDFRSAKKSAVMLHVKAKHGLSGVNALRRCPHCDHVTAHVSNLRTHILARHSLQKPWLCEQCGKKFADKSYYNAHMKRHRNDLRYPCPSCDVRFLLPSHLRAHMESRHSDVEQSPNIRVPHCSQLNDSQLHILGPEDDSERNPAGKLAWEENPAGNCRQPVHDHDYSRCANPDGGEICSEVFECLECSSFFASFESLRVHTHTEHGKNENFDRRPQ